jgi:hypothetical protein
VEVKVKKGKKKSKDTGKSNENRCRHVAKGKAMKGEEERRRW